MGTKRYIGQEDNKIFLIKEEETTFDGRLNVKTIKEEMTNESVINYLEEDKTQAERFAKQEKDTVDKIKLLNKNIKEHSGDRGYKAYKKNFNKYEMLEKIIELKFNVDIFSDEIKKELKSYNKKRDTYKNFYVTKTMEQQLEDLENNLVAFDDIRKERSKFLELIEEVKGLL